MTVSLQGENADRARRVQYASPHLSPGMELRRAARGLSGTHPDQGAEGHSKYRTWGRPAAFSIGSGWTLTRGGGGPYYENKEYQQPDRRNDG